MIRTIGFISCLVCAACIGAVGGSISQAKHIRYSCDNPDVRIPTVIDGHEYACVDYNDLMRALAKAHKESNV